MSQSATNGRSLRKWSAPIANGTGSRWKKSTFGGRLKLFRQGELGRLIIDALRRAGKPLGTHEITSALLDASGYGESARAGLGPRVRGNLAYQERRQTVTRAGSGKDVRWTLMG